MDERAGERGRQSRAQIRFGRNKQSKETGGGLADTSARGKRMAVTRVKMRENGTKIALLLAYLQYL